MKNRRFRPLIYAAVALVTVWAVALAIYHFSGRSRMTVGKLQQYVDATDLNRLSGSGRDQAISDFAGMVNSLSADERMQWRLQDGWKKWFAEMTEAERAKFIDKTLPAGFKQILDSFSQLPADQRKQFIDGAVARLKQVGATGVDKSLVNYGPNGPPPLSPELEQKAREIGLKELYTGSSPETKAELAPLLEQLQIQLRGGPGR
jgi:hypothetical protein